MKTHFLFPRHFKNIGWLLFVPALIAAVILPFTDHQLESDLQANVFAFIDDNLLGPTVYFSVIENAVVDEILLSMLIIGGLFIGFSRLRNEDEMSGQLRYESLVWAAYVNFAVMLFATLFIYGGYYFQALIANVFTLLFFFIIRFHLMLYKAKKSADDEE